MTVLKRKPLTVKASDIHGYGVFADVDIFPGEIIEQCYYLLVPCSPAILEDFSFKPLSSKGKWQHDNVYAIPLGNGVIYNHSSEPNARYEFNGATHIMTIEAERCIQRGEEIYLSYGNEWFEQRQMTPKIPASVPLRVGYRAKWFLYKNQGYLRMLFAGSALFGIVQLLNFYRLAL